MASQQKYPHLACLHRDEGHENSDACLCPNHFAELNRKLLMETCPMANLGDESAIFWRADNAVFCAHNCALCWKILWDTCSHYSSTKSINRMVQ